MCCINSTGNFGKLMSKATLDATFRERFLADPLGTAREWGFSEADMNILAQYDVRKLRAITEGPCSKRSL